MNTQPAGQPQPKSKLWLVLLIIIIVVAIVGGGIYIYFKYYRSAQTSTTPTSAPTTETPSADEPMDPGLGSMPDIVTQGWPVYTNDEFGYSFIYPPFMTPEILQGGGGVALGAEDPKMVIDANAVKNETNDTLAEYVDAYQTNLYKGVDGEQLETSSATTLDGVAAQARLWRYWTKTTPTNSQTEQKAHRFIAVAKGNNVYVFEMMVPYADYSDRKDYFERIVKSYEFK